MALAGHPCKVYALATSGTPSGSDEVAGIMDVGFDPKTNMIDVTDFKDTSGFEIKLSALKSGAISMSGNFEEADAPQILLRTSWTTGASVWITTLFAPSASAGSQGFKTECKVESFSVKSTSAGKVDFSAALSFSGAPVAV